MVIPIVVVKIDHKDLIMEARRPRKATVIVRGLSNGSLDWGWREVDRPEKGLTSIRPANILAVGYEEQENPLFFVLTALI